MFPSLLSACAVLDARGTISDSWLPSDMHPRKQPTRSVRAGSRPARRSVPDSDPARPASFTPVSRRKKLSKLGALGALRRRTKWTGYLSLSDFPRSVKDSRFVSPYTEGAREVDSAIFVMLQDWASEEHLRRDPAPEILTIGRDPRLPTNRRLEELLEKHFRRGIHSIFATNLFPYIKPGRIDGPIPFADLRRAACIFGVPQIQAVAPRLVVCLGLSTFNAVRAACGLSRVRPLGKAVRSPFRLGFSQVWCQAHTGSRGQQNRGRARADRDWRRMARSVGKVP